AMRPGPAVAYIVGRIAVAETGQVGGIDGEVVRQGPDIADPMDPRARATMEHQQRRLRRALRPDMPPHPAVPAGASRTHGDLDGLGCGGDGFDMFESGTAVRHARDGGVIET